MVTMSDYETDPSDDEDSQIPVAPQAQQNKLYPYPFIGIPYQSNSVLNSLDLQLAIKAVGEICRSRVNCLQLQSSSALHLQHVLFGAESVSFSKISG